jgi:hypothetical protein
MLIYGSYLPAALQESILADSALGERDPEEFKKEPGKLALGEPQTKVQEMTKSPQPRSNPVRGSPKLVSCKVRMPASHPLATATAATEGHPEAAQLQTHLLRKLQDGSFFLAIGRKLSATMRTGRRWRAHRHVLCVHRIRGWRRRMGETAFSWLSAWPLGIGSRSVAGERSGRTALSAPEILVLSTQTRVLRCQTLVLRQSLSKLRLQPLDLLLLAAHDLYKFIVGRALGCATVLHLACSTV